MRAAPNLVLQAGHITEVGLVRKENQDYVAVWTKRAGLDLLIVLCDGMGGHAAGDVASRVTVETMLAVLEADGRRDNNPDRFAAALERANATVYGLSLQDPSRAGMGSTLVLAAVQGDLLTIMNVGDSPAYLYRNGVIYQLHEEHTWPQEQLRQGVITAEQAATSPYRNRLTRAVGVGETVEPYARQQEIMANDILVLSSDGVMAGGVTHEEVVQRLRQGPIGDVLQDIMDRCYDGGAPDNVTIAAVKVVAPADATRRLPELPTEEIPRLEPATQKLAAVPQPEQLSA